MTTSLQSNPTALVNLEGPMPSLKVTIWKSQVDDLVESLCREHFPKGLTLYYPQYTDEELARMQIAREPPLARPEAPNAAATNGAHSLYRLRLHEYQDYVKALDMVLQTMIASLPEADREALRDPTTGMRLITHAQVRTRVINAYGTPNQSDIRQLRALASGPFDVSRTVFQNTTTAKQNFHTLSLIGADFGAFDKYSILATQANQHPNLLPTVTRYERENDSTAWSYDALAAALDTDSKKIRDGAVYATATPPRVGPFAGGAAPGKKSAPLYCFKHGFNLHLGNVCSAMKAEGYSPEQISAKAPTSVGGTFTGEKIGSRTGNVSISDRVTRPN